MLNLPFDEADGAVKTYDYSSNRADGVVTGAGFEAGRSNNCINFTGTGKCEVEQSVLNLNASFTLATFVKVHKPSSKLVVVFNYAGVGNYVQLEVDVEAEAWYYLAVVRNGQRLEVYLNGALYTSGTVPSEYGNPVGFAVAQDGYASELGNACLDETKFYQLALTQEAILSLLDNTKQLSFLLDGKDIKQTYGVCVSKVSGIADALKMKDPLKVDWDGYHGEQVDLSRPRFEARDITLECFIKTDGGKIAFMQAVQAFFEQLTAKHEDNTLNGANGELVQRGLHRLMIDIHPTKPLVYEIYRNDLVEVDKEWNDAKMIGTFALRLREPEPVKRVLKHLRTNDSTKRISVTLTTSKLVNIYWGDGTTTQDVFGTGVTITHDYQSNGEYFAIITGIVEEITDFDTNAIVVWNKL